MKAHNGVQSSMNLHMNYRKYVIGISENLESISWNHRIVEIQMLLHSWFTPTHPFCIVTYQKKERKTWISMQSLHTDAFSRFFFLFGLNKNECVQVNLCQKLLFLHQLTHNMTKNCSLNYEFSTTWKLQAQNMLCT